MYSDFISSLKRSCSDSYPIPGSGQRNLVTSY